MVKCLSTDHYSRTVCVSHNNSQETHTHPCVQTQVVNHVNWTKKEKKKNLFPQISSSEADNRHAFKGNQNSLHHRRKSRICVIRNLRPICSPYVWLQRCVFQLQSCFCFGGIWLFCTYLVIYSLLLYTQCIKWSLSLCGCWQPIT